MSSNIVFVVIIGLLYAVVQADSGQLSEKESSISESSDVSASARNKRWAVEPRERYGSQNTPTRYYNQGYKYPSNLMTLLRGRRSWPDASSSWRLPSNLMTLLRGRRSWPSGNTQWKVPSNLMALLRGKKSSDDDDDIDEVLPESDAEDEPNTLDSLLDGYIPDDLEKRSSFYKYSPRGSRSMWRPYGARQFMIWDGSRYILG